MVWTGHTISHIDWRYIYYRSRDKKWSEWSVKMIGPPLLYRLRRRPIVFIGQSASYTWNGSKVITDNGNRLIDKDVFDTEMPIYAETYEEWTFDVILRNVDKNAKDMKGTGRPVPRKSWNKSIYMIIRHTGVGLRSGQSTGRPKVHKHALKSRLP